MKRFIHRLAVWLEYLALDLQSWSEPAVPQIDLREVVVGAINRAPNEFWKNATTNNALLKRLQEQS